ncbi:LysR family transcriptional regulator [Alkalibacter mobilis]|uniref:LysR family transcriptional regulator n=1 Tax=Alkalibacter mobilis TaxID=2787712 RepID=UPI00189F6429|nr:LysR family transcriptional regulator [Alkalibacter mobilis]MBF7096639.1 LysR family transcriptional regulator [Alkalibacter mobilis]
MDVRYLTYVIEIAEQGNMTKAAENLFVSQSSLSQYLSKLESELGTPLFDRMKGELRLTQAGEMYLEAAKSVINIQRKLYQNLNGLSDTGKIILGITSQWGLKMMTEIISKFKDRFPNVTLEIIEDNVIPITKLIHSEKVDLALMAANDCSEFGDQCEILRREEVVFALPNSHKFCALHRDDLKDISQNELKELFKDDSFILSKQGSTIRFIADKILKMNNFVPDTVCEMNSMVAVREMVSKGIGVSFIPSTCAEPNHNVTYFSFSPKVFRYNIIAYRKNLVLNNPEKYLINLFKNYQLNT